MKNKIILFLIIFLSSSAFANCFIAKESNKTIKQEGECEKRYSPASTFKIPLSLIGFDSGIFKDESKPVWSCKSCDYFINVCKLAHNPRTWMRDSCVWYSQILIKKLGIEKFQKYVKQFNYGNMDISGGLNKSWLSSSLQISPIEQIEFLQKIIYQKLPISKISYDKSKSIMFVQEMSGGWKLYGKTGNNITDLQNGWFVGWIEKDNRFITFASHIVDDKPQEVFASFRARNKALNKLWYIINELEK